MTRRALLALALAACTPAPPAEGSTTDATSTSTTTTTTSTTDAPTTGTTGTVDGVPGEVDLGLPVQGFLLLDLDDDGHTDLVMGAYDAAVQVLRGRGDGSFEPPIFLGDNLDDYVDAIVPGDFDGDGSRDLAVKWGGFVALLRGGLDDPRETLHTLASGAAVAAADADRDGIDDLFLPGANMLLRLRGRPDGFFEPRPPLGLGGEPADIAAADLDADGLVDLVVANTGTDDLSLLRGDGAGGFQPQLLLSVGDQPFQVAARDLDGDAILDLVVLDVDGIMTLRGLGDLAFAAPDPVALPEYYSPWHASFVVCERDGDPHPEVLVSSNVNSYGWIAQFDVAAARLVDPRFLRTGRGVREMACADLDGHPRDDLVFSAYRPDRGTHTLRLLLSSHEHVF